MPNNVFIGFNAVVAKATASFQTAGITAVNTTQILKINPDGFQVYQPTETINGITGFVENGEYWIVAKQNMDLTAYVVPPVEPAGQPLPSPVLLWADTFNSADVADINGRTTTSGAKTWERFGGQSGTIGISGNQAVWTAGDAAHYYVNQSNGRNVDARFTLGSNPTPDTYPFAYGALAFVDPDNCYLFELVTAKVYKRIAGNTAEIYPGSGTSVSGDIMRTRMRGTSLEVYRNDTLLTTLTINGSDIPGTATGLWSTATNESGINAIEVYTAPF